MKEDDTMDDAKTTELAQARKAELFDNAVAAVCDLYEGEDLYEMLHHSFGLTDREIRDQRYLTGEELAQFARSVPEMGPVMG